ncbi:MAG: AmiS/UreI family transporter [Actinomycetes bacterium]
MGNVGLLYVGAILFLNGCMLLGWVEAKSAAPLNLFVGALQVITPTYLIFTANGDENTILAASGLYLFGFTYLYVGINLLARLDGTGVGFFSGFVAVCAVVFAGLNFGRFDDNAFGVIWLYWAFLWTLFFLVLGVKRDGLTRYTGAVCAIQGWVTGAIPAALLLTGNWADNKDVAAVSLAVFAVVVFGGLYPTLRAKAPPVVPAQQQNSAPATGSVGASNPG